MESGPEGEDSNSQFEKPVSPETLAGFEAYINEGAFLIKGGRYEDAIEHFHNSEELQKVNKTISFGGGRSRSLNGIPKPEEIERYSDEFAMNSNAESMPEIIFLQSVPVEQRKLPIDFAREIAFVYMEEWLHVLQEVKGGMLAGHENPEIDVALYMEGVGIQLTPIFLKRYDRAKILGEIKERESSENK